MNYNLLDYPLPALRIISKAIDEKIKALTDQAEGGGQYFDEQFLSDVTRRDKQELSVLREHQVHLLTAIQVVKDREKVLSN